MDAEILKFICASQGAVDADVLMFNLFPGASANEVISNKKNLVLFSWNGQQKVVARTGLKLCRVRDCLGSCGHLHLCKNFLFSGLCPRRICSFCHDMDSGYNQWVLKHHELDHLSRAELSTLLLQSDSTLLPPICYEYNAGNDEFGRCQSGVACSRLHICKKFLSQDCRCSKIHDFYAPQPLKSLYDKGVPDTLISSLRSVYANREALRISSRQSTAAPISTNATTEVGGNIAQRHRGRERGGNKGQWGHKGNSGHRGKPLLQQQTPSCSGLLGTPGPSSKKGLSEDDDVQQELNSSNSDLSTAGIDTDSKSTDKQKVKQRHRNRRRRGGKSGDKCHKGSEGNEANLENPLQQQTASSYVHASDALDLTIEATNEGDKQQEELNSPKRDASTVEDTNAKSNNGFNLEQRQWNQGTGVNEGNTGKSLQQQTFTLNDALAKFGSLDLLNKDGLNKLDIEEQRLNLSKINVSAVVKDPDVSNISGQSTQQVEDLKQSSASGRGYEQDDQQQLHRSCSTAVSAAAASKDGHVGDVQKTKLNPVKDKSEICIYYITGYCKHESRCDKAHQDMPYRWQVLVGDFWTALPHNETIEKDYCDPKNTYSSSSNPPVHFNTMTCGRNKVRRLSTPNSVVEPDLLHTTEWLWYWQDEFGKWNLYGSYTRGHGSADITSLKLEQKFLTNDKDILHFTAGSQPYSLSFQDMIQTNKRYSTKKLVTRRPLFVSAEDVKTKKVRKPLNSTSVPDNWDKTQILPTGFLKVALRHTSDEYLKIAALFYSTMQNFEILQIERIQNKPLWEVFQWQKNLMKNKNGGCDVAERQLFHGTDSDHVDAICHDNFDWRICGTHGTVYGKGSYFARHASYSHAYTGDTNIRAMFIARVLVGSYTKGVSSYLRPPSKDGEDKIFYDSCVDSVVDPSIFVVFEKHQIYPEYLIQYMTIDPLGDLVSPVRLTNQCVLVKENVFFSSV